MKEYLLRVDLKDIDIAAREFLAMTRGFRVFAFTGELGAGKTTFISALGRALGVREIVSSPTFSIVQQYDSDQGNIYHIDLYRIKGEEEAANAGIEDCIMSGDICMIEWPGNAEGLLPADTVRVAIETVDEDTRQMKILIP